MIDRLATREFISFQQDSVIYAWSFFRQHRLVTCGDKIQVPGFRCRKKAMGRCGPPIKVLLLSSMSATLPRGHYALMKSPEILHDEYPSPPHSHNSSESSLRALELSEGAEPLSLHPTRTRRSNSIGVFQFQEDLLPLSLSEAERDDDGVAEKTVGLFKGKFSRLGPSAIE